MLSSDRELMISNGVLLKSKDELENQLSETRMKLLSSETNLRTLQSDLSNINLLLQENVNKLSLAQHQTKLYEGEVKNLRSLLQSYEAEFKIGTSSIYSTCYCLFPGALVHALVLLRYHDHR